ncbi:hypothetical protein [Lacticaseibacillus suihuaensis]
MTVAFGIDVSAATSEVAIVVDRVKVREDKIDNDWFGFQQLLKQLKNYTEPQIVFEARGLSFAAPTSHLPTKRRTNRQTRADLPEFVLD